MIFHLACAQIAPPAGGPEDKTAPAIIAYFPDSINVGIAPDSPLRFTFSEKMNKSSVRDWLLIAPWPEKLNFSWVDNTFICRSDLGWNAETGYAVVMGAQATDAHKIPMENSFSFYFTTGDSLPTGKVFGQLNTRGLSKQGVTICLFEWPPDLDPAILEVPEHTNTPLPEPRQALRITQTDGEGQFLLSHVSRNRNYLLGAFYDDNGNRSYDPAEDLWAFAPRQVGCALSDSSESAESFYLVYADEPGDIYGALIDSSCVGYRPPQLVRAKIDSLASILSGERDAQGFVAGNDSLPEIALTAAERESLTVGLSDWESILVRSLADSQRCSAPIYTWVLSDTSSTPVEEVSGDREYVASGVAAGIYRVVAFRDLNGNRERDPEEPAGEFPYPIDLKPGRTMEGVDIELQSAVREVDRSGQ
jgi:Bacterial Ig-like domain